MAESSDPESQPVSIPTKIDSKMSESLDPESWIPKLGMFFNTDEKAYHFYSLYGRELGFGVRKHLVKRRSSGSVYSRVFACCLNTCQAHLTVKATGDASPGFRVTEFEESHNHPLIKATSSTTEALFSVTEPSNGLGERSWVPKIEMEFTNDELAYQFYANYAGRIGFNVRKHLVKKRVSGVVYSRTYVCHREGEAKVSKPERTGCLALLTIKIARNGRYRVTEFERKHNHPLVNPAKGQLRHCDSSEVFGTPDNAIDLSEFLAETQRPEDGQRERRLQLGFCSVGYKNYIPTCRERVIEAGDVGAVLQYAQEKQIEDPSFYYALQLDGVDQLTNFFWTDARAMVDFECFCDVLCFDTSYKTSGYGRPFAQFIGVNHHKQAISFGAALLYDETEESFKWLFNSFKAAMHGRQPKMILTDRSLAMSNAISAVWSGATHRFCVWQLYNYAPKRLNDVFLRSATFEEDLSRCMYDVAEEKEFELRWKMMLEKYDLNSNEWLAELYKDREKWSLAYGREKFSADMKNTLINECKNDTLKRYLNPERNLSDFFRHYERIVQEQRHAELEADIDARQLIRRKPSLRMLRQTVTAYTPTVFKIFQQEFEESIDCMVHISGQIGTTFEYKVTVEEDPKEYIVRYDSSNGQIFCTCQKFESVGIQCRHVLKTLDIINIKQLPPHYILKRWTKDAKRGRLNDNCEILDGVEIKSPQAKRHSSLCGVFNKIAGRAAVTAESYKFIETLSEQLMGQVCQILQSRPPEKP